MQNKKPLIKKPNKFLKVLKWIGIIIAALLVFGFISEQILEFVDRETVLKNPPGQMMQVGDRRMHIYCTGENKNGSPTVILESGGGAIYTTWYKVQPEISKYTKVCSYDRAGYGFSDAANDARTNLDIDNDLSNLLAVANIEQPYILVGHSEGAKHARIFTSRHMSEMKGLVLVDSEVDEEQQIFQNEDQAIKNLPLSQKIIMKFFGTTMNLGPYVGLSRLALWINPEATYGVARGDKIGTAFSSLPMSKQYRNKNQSEEEDFALTVEARNFGNLPLRVLYENDPFASAQMDPLLGGPGMGVKTHLNEATFSTNSKATLVPNSGHYIQIDQPQYVIDAIKELL